jgi:hypothetical protein
MSFEFTQPGEEFASPRDVVAKVLSELGAESVDQLDPRTKAELAFMFHIDRSERDLRDWLPVIGLDEDQAEQVFGLLCARAGEMFDLLSALVGYDGDYSFGQGVKYLKDR